MNEETLLHNDLVRFSKSLFERGLTAGSSGNISARSGDAILITPTNSCLGFLDSDRISKISRDGVHVSGDPPSKEVFLHLAFYKSRPATGAVVHLHSTYATLLSCLEDTDPENAIPALTPYVVMRVGRVRLMPYVPPGDPAMGGMIEALHGQYAGVLLGNHGPVVAGTDLASAVYAAEELEETAKLAILSKNMRSRELTPADIAELERRFTLK